ncbi:hypothetical protein RF11_01815 [Thelohanellus kitauei]|uniref:ISXO2-like transposase domain-containing protein n=1 Tax=Thelohanellus kitauei TaxID=669202 RepID=A0A0C2N3D9_THEKT|nr:hypothetical protein RF11_01815 [Thelohanellus kitauei]
MERNDISRAIIIIFPDRKRDTLLPIIHNNIEPRSIIVSDEWASYNGLEDAGYTHLTACHRRNFTIENLWRWAKSRVKTTTTDADHKILRMADFLWRRRCPNAFENIINHIADSYFD